jgi:hypothetical protein
MGNRAQLESETKTRLRPFMSRLGLSIAQNDVSAQVVPFAQGFASKSWRQHMEELVSITSIYIEKFQALADASPDSERKVTQSMVVHEKAIRNSASWNWRETVRIR